MTFESTLNETKEIEYKFLNFPLLVLKHPSSQSEYCFPNQICWNKNNNTEQISTFDLDKTNGC